MLTPSPAAQDLANEACPLDELRTAFSAILGEDFDTATAEDMAVAARARLSELSDEPGEPAAFEADMLRELLVLATGRAPGVALH